MGYNYVQDRRGYLQTSHTVHRPHYRAAHHHMPHMKTIFKYYTLTLAADTLLCMPMRDRGFEERLGTGMIIYPFAMPSFL